MSRNAASLALVVGLAVVSSGCDGVPAGTATSSRASASTASTPSAATSAVASSSTAASARPSASTSLASLGLEAPGATTSPTIARKNFEAQLVEAARLLEARPDDLMVLSAALSAEHDRVTFFGQMGGIDRVLELTDRAVKAHPKDPKAHVLRSSARSAIHDFKGALAALDDASKLGADPQEVASKRAVIAMALGDYDAAEPVLAADAKRFPNLGSLGLHATCLGHMGRTEASEQAFRAAEASYRDVSPFAIAWLYFNRAEMWDRAGNPDRARAIYRMAVERLPFFARGAIHLSELLPPAEAKPYLDAVATSADDPEVASALFHVTEGLNPGSGQAHRERAATRYAELMSKYPLAFADHAAEFHLGVTKDAAKALEATTLNLGNRKTATSYVLHLEALAAAGKSKEACATAEDAARLKYPTAELRERVAEASKGCRATSK
jgi:tetratricopeptide (TPR) repeat protein